MKTTAALLIAFIAASTVVASPAIKIKNHSVNFRKTKSGSALDPSVTIDAGAQTTRYATRPVVTMIVLLKTKDTGTLEVVKLNYVWANGLWQTHKKPEHTIKWSREQPACDYKELSPKTLRTPKKEKLETRTYKSTPKILAIKTRLYIGGQLADESETKERAGKSPQGIRITKHAINIEKVKRYGNSDVHVLRPSVAIRNDARTTVYDTRPLLTMSILTKETGSGTIAVLKTYFDWGGGEWLPQPADFDPTEESIKQPPCDYKAIANETIRDKAEHASAFSDLGLPDRPKILATKARLYIAGTIAAEQEEKTRHCTWNDWENI
ncbi:hypothetical protein PDESU_04738 [Pontiella desulfatans]|uniref:Uncharacterized protein n=1 Tax=Pontiella desulfatans TaxID=2750659 RepID=A0A6C2U7S3_PONDE|nr:hypothetical protein [Pontiella desulfatans]VGO16148.1 hypothetical protein PDESU_04738 [Pontiella desulfatans]